MDFLAIVLTWTNFYKWSKNLGRTISVILIDFAGRFSLYINDYSE